MKLGEEKVKGWESVLVLENPYETEHLATAEIKILAVFQKHICLKKIINEKLRRL